MKHLLTIAVLLAATVPVTAQFTYPPVAPADNVIEEARVHMWTYEGLKYGEFVAVVQAAHRFNVATEKGERLEGRLRDLEQKIEQVQHAGTREGLLQQLDAMRQRLNRPPR